MSKPNSKRSAEKPAQRVKTKPGLPARPAKGKRTSLRSNPSSAAAPRALPATLMQRPDTKQAKVIAMLEAAAGATMDAMVQATGWQQHSVRGFLAGVVRKKLGRELVSDGGGSERIYRIVDRSDGRGTKNKRAAAAA